MSKVIQYINLAANDPQAFKKNYLLTSMRIELHGGHEHVSIWSGGQKTGTLVFDEGQGERFCDLLRNLSIYEWKKETEA